MKLHLPVSLFRALVLFMLTAPAVQAAETSGDAMPRPLAASSSDYLEVKNRETKHASGDYSLKNYDEVFFFEECSVSDERGVRLWWCYLSEWCDYS